MTEYFHDLPAHTTQELACKFLHQLIIHAKPFSGEKLWQQHKLRIKAWNAISEAYRKYNSA